jgi:uncharacterized small protein (DUF1192 family)
MDLSGIIKEVDEEIDNLESSINQLQQRVSILESEITRLFSSIKKCDSSVDANDYFQQLEIIQSILSKVSFMAKIELPDRLNKFIREFERVDDMRTRNLLFQEIKMDKWV